MYKEKPIGKIKYVGRTTQGNQLIDGKIYDVLRISGPFFKIVDDSDDGYVYYPVKRPCELLNPTIYGKWEIVEDPTNLITSVLNYFTSREKAEEEKHQRRL